MRDTTTIDPTSAILASSARETTLLVVDDDVIQRRVIARIGAQAGHRTMMAASLAEARDALGKEPIDCLTIDLGLGAESGLELLRGIAENSRSVEVLIISGASGSVLESTRAFARRNGVELFDLFTKPLDLIRLRASLSRARKVCSLRQRPET